ncbi:MAG: tRNA uridine-5-carboxymethylaminomethyl(34) synthesis GTPase MnmE [Kouleothrix sp.]|jgi:tRNA modification GTPase|nr:tRNA uridine-5-carboxymethylaminomethyl(34) synthesis GTPase MnmE [Kouleothrix sp.]
MIYDDTIAAIATPPGEGGIGVVRISGPAAPAILALLFRPARAGAWRPFRMRYGHVAGPAGRALDEALAVYMRAPRSYTGEDVAEISCHGGPLVLSRVLALALAAGARAAEPGEFTMRAFVHGRIDLAQAEATLDIIRAKTDTALALAQAQLGGWLSGELRRVRTLLLGPLAYWTALVDFPEDEVEPQPLEQPLAAALADLERLLAGAEQGIVYRQGARVVLVGRPNAGKSSLLNALLRTDRAIVTPIPGTTRDTLEEIANLHGIPLVLIDTAGITASSDPVEQLGVARSRAALAAADLALLVIDASAPATPEDAEIAALVAAKPTILVLNKIDLLADDPETHRPGQQQHGQAAHAGLPAHAQLAATIATSAVSGAGLDALAQAVAAALLGGAPLSGERLVSNPRHRDALARAAGHVRDGLAGYRSGVPADLLTVDLTAALAAIGEITGDGIHDDLLATIFSTFCIGK